MSLNDDKDLQADSATPTPAGEAAAELAATAEEASQPEKRLSPFRRSPSLLIGTIIVAFFVLMAIFPQVFTSRDPYAIDGSQMLQPPSAEHLMGTDNFGYDIWTRVVYATSLDLIIGIASVSLPFVVGVLLGLLAGYYGGKLDSIIMRVLDCFVAFPFMVLAIAIVAILGSGVRNLIIAMWVVSWPEYTRLVRAEVLVAKQSEYVQAAKTLGYSDMRIMFRHILPNVISSSVVYAASDVVMCIMTGAGMSFLGLGVPQPTPEWGAIISGGKSFITTAPWISILPGIMMAIVGLGLSLVGDGLNDLLRTKD